MSDTRIDLILELTRETRDDVSTLVANDARNSQRLIELERRADAVDVRLQTPAPPPVPAPTTGGLKRDVGLTAGVSAAVVALIQILAALGWIPAPAQAAPPPAMLAPPAP